MAVEKIQRVQFNGNLNQWIRDYRIALDRVIDRNNRLKEIRISDSSEAKILDSESNLTVILPSSYSRAVTALLKMQSQWDDGWLVYVNGVQVAGNPYIGWGDQHDIYVNSGITLTGLKKGDVISVTAYNTVLSPYIIPNPWSYTPWTILVTYPNGTTANATVGSTDSGIDYSNTNPVLRPSGSYAIP